MRAPLGVPGVPGLGGEEGGDPLLLRQFGPAAVDEALEPGDRLIQLRDFVIAVRDLFVIFIVEVACVDEHGVHVIGHLVLVAEGSDHDCHDPKSGVGGADVLGGGLGFLEAEPLGCDGRGGGQPAHQNSDGHQDDDHDDLNWTHGAFSFFGAGFFLTGKPLFSGQK